MRRSTPLFALLLALSTGQMAMAASYSDPVGLWEISGKSTLRASFSGLTLPSSVKIGDTLQFHEDGRVNSQLLSTLGDGQWLAPGKGAYRIRYDVNQFRESDIPSLLFRIANLFSEAILKNFGTTFIVEDIKVKSYRDSGKLLNKGLAMKGSVIVKANLKFKTAEDHKTVIAKLDFRTRYKGERISAPSRCCSSDDPAQNLAESQAFLAENATLPKVRQTASGLQYRVIEEGTGIRPGPTETVTVNYRGLLPSGERFDGNSNVSFALDRVIPGWTEGLQLMQEGAYYRFYIPPELAYGETGSGSGIKPNTALIFDVQLLKVGG